MTKPVLDRRLFEAGKIIFEEGHEGNCAYIIEFGEVEISKMIDGEQRVLAILNENCLFGELALIDSKPRMASAKAKTTVSIIRVNRVTFNKKLENADGFLRGLINILVDNARSSDTRQTVGFKQTIPTEDTCLPPCNGIYNEATWTNCFGSHTYTNGAFYSGEWKDGKRHGQGKYIYADGRTFEGIFENDKFKTTP